MTDHVTQTIKKPMADYSAAGWKVYLQGGPYHGQWLRLPHEGMREEISFHGGAALYRRHVWLDDDGKPVVLTEKRSKKDGGPREVMGYRYEYEDTGFAWVKLVMVVPTHPDNREWLAANTAYEVVAEFEDQATYMRLDWITEQGREILWEESHLRELDAA